MAVHAVAAEASSTHRLSLSAKVAIGLAAGIATGLVIGERAATLQVFADAYVKLLQMTVLPYVTLSLVSGLGALSLGQAGKLGARVGMVLIGLWAIALLAVFTFPLMFPTLQTASFFSTTLLEELQPFDLVDLYIPANPFNSLANNIVPAVVLFSAMLGVALIGVPAKQIALESLDVIKAAVGKVANFIVALTPYGLFAIAAVVAGTFEPAQAVQLEVYLAAYVVVSLLLTLWVLPGLVAALTPVPQRALLSATRDALILSFTTGSLFVVLPMLADETRQLLHDHTSIPKEDDRLADIIIPASFNFPHTAKLLSLSFVLFAAWFTGTSLTLRHYPSLAGSGLLVMFGGVNVAIPFLLNLFRIPTDTYQLFLATGIVNSRFGTVLSAVHTVTLAILGACAVTGMLRFDMRRLLRFAAITLVIGIVTIGGTRLLLDYVASQPYDKDKVLAAMETLRQGKPSQVFRSPAPPLAPFNGTVLDRVLSRKMLRVGYFDDSLPYVFTNARGDLVGFDVEMAVQLAKDLNVGVEFAPVSRGIFDGGGLDPAFCDLVMSGAVVTTDRAAHMRFSAPYLDETVAFVVLDHRRVEFSSWDTIRAEHGLRIGSPKGAYYVQKIRDLLPHATIVTFDGIEPFFGPHDPPLDALAVTAERGSAYTLLHPEYSVAVPKPHPLKVPLAYVVAGRDEALARVVDTWIDLKRNDGTIDALFAHWILGQNAEPHHRRWCVLDDVLHWGD